MVAYREDPGVGFVYPLKIDPAKRVLHTTCATTITFGCAQPSSIASALPSIRDRVDGAKRAEIQAKIEQVLRERFESSGLLLSASIPYVNFTEETPAQEQKQIAHSRPKMHFVLDKQRRSRAHARRSCRFKDSRHRARARPRH